MVTVSWCARAREKERERARERARARDGSAARARERGGGREARAAEDGGRVLRLPNAGHQLFVDNPAAFARAVITCAGPALSRCVPEEWRDPLGSSARS